MPTPESADVPMALLPTPRMAKFESEKFVFVNVMLGNTCCSSVVFVMFCRANCAPENALTAIGTSWSDCDWRWAVTTISSTPDACAAAAGPVFDDGRCGAPAVVDDVAVPVEGVTAVSF